MTSLYNVGLGIDILLRGKGAGVSAEEETKWRKWVDERFVKVITANIYRSWE